MWIPIFVVKCAWGNLFTACSRFKRFHSILFRWVHQRRFGLTPINSLEIMLSKSSLAFSATLPTLTWLEPSESQIFLAFAAVLGTRQQSHGFSSHPLRLSALFTLLYCPNTTNILCCLTAFSTILLAFSTSSEFAPGIRWRKGTGTSDTTVVLFESSYGSLLLATGAFSSSLVEFLFRSLFSFKLYFLISFSVAGSISSSS